MTSPADDGVAADLQDFRSGAGVVAAPCSLLWVEGPDAERFLQGLLTNDIAALAGGESCPALLLDDKGRIQAGMTVARDAATGFTLVLDPASGGSVADSLAGFHFSEDLELIGPEEAWRVVSGPEMSQAQVDIEIIPRVPSTHEAVVSDLQAFLPELGVPQLSGEVFSVLRVEAGVPRIGVDTTTRTLVQEAALEDLTVSFSKGCYLGQETVARVAHRGGVKKRLRGLVGDAELRVGAEVTAGDASLGTLTSAATSPEHGHIGLAILRTSAEAGDQVQVGDVAARVATLPFTA